MTRLVVLGMLALTLSAGSGCGTVMNLEDKPAIGLQRPPGTPANRVYGGVRLDADRGWDALSDGSNPALGMYLWFVDLPLSALGDTVTLPITLRAAMTGRGPTKVVDPPPEALLKW
jgi:uncharacterized protein YceK